jgi:HPt (histidine-containing phosphotransfer) domain-containing protein
MPHVTLDQGVLASLRQLTLPGEPDVLHEVLTVFIQDVPRRVASLSAAAAGGRVAEAARAAHSLKGSAGNIGARRLQALAATLEEAAGAGAMHDVRARADAIQREFAAVDAEIRRILADGLRV